MDFSSNYVPVSSSSDTNIVDVDNVLGTLKEFLPQDVSTNYDQFVDIVKQDYKSFKPLGEKIEEYSRENSDGSVDHFEIYKVDLQCSLYDIHTIQI